MKKILDIIDRVKNKKAIGVIFNVPKEVEARLEEKLRNEKHIIIKGSNAFTGAMLNYRLGIELKVKHFHFSMLPGLINGSIICVKGADAIKLADNFLQLSKNNGRLLEHLITLVKKTVQETGDELSVDLIDEAAQSLLT